MIWLLFVMASFSAYRLSMAITQEEGPLRLFERFRNLFITDNWIGRGVRCFLCVSFWVALPLAGLFSWALYHLEVPLLLLSWWGIAGAAVVLEKYWKR